MLIFPIRGSLRIPNGRVRLGALLGIGFIKKPRDMAQIEKDIDRSLNSFDVTKSFTKA